MWRLSLRRFSDGGVLLLLEDSHMPLCRMIIMGSGLFLRIHGSRGIYGMFSLADGGIDGRAIHRHPRDFPDPDRFYPDRYLKENRLPYPNEKGYHTFGWGRRGIYWFSIDI